MPDIKGMTNTEKPAKSSHEFVDVFSAKHRYSGTPVNVSFEKKTVDPYAGTPVVVPYSFDKKAA